MLEDLGNAISQEASEIFTLLDEVNGGIATLDKMAKEDNEWRKNKGWKC